MVSGRTPALVGVHPDIVSGRTPNTRAGRPDPLVDSLRYVISHTVRRAVDVPVERVFDLVVAEDVLPKVLHRWGPVPGVSGTRDLTGAWDQPGSSRTVLLADGSSVRETLTAFERPRLFRYRIDTFTNPLRWLAGHGTGSWLFMAFGSSSEFSWSYSFAPRSRAASVLLGVFVRVAWSRYMEQCADLCVRLANPAS
jgi:hypothetical protein